MVAMGVEFESPRFWSGEDGRENSSGFATYTAMYETCPTSTQVPQPAIDLTAPALAPTTCAWGKERRNTGKHLPSTEATCCGETSYMCDMKAAGSYGSG